AHAEIGELGHPNEVDPRMVLAFPPLRPPPLPAPSSPPTARHLRLPGGLKWKMERPASPDCRGWGSPPVEAKGATGSGERSKTFTFTRGDVLCVDPSDVLRALCACKSRCCWRSSSKASQAQVPLSQCRFSSTYLVAYPRRKPPPGLQ